MVFIRVLTDKKALKASNMLVFTDGESLASVQKSILWNHLFHKMIDISVLAVIKSSAQQMN